MINKMETYFNCLPGTPPIGVKGDYRCSVHFGNTFRLDKAREQASCSPVEVKIITTYVNDFFKSIEMNAVVAPIIYNPLQIDYEKIKRDYVLAELGDIVWMKFTKDGYLGVVATSNDINFDIPNNKADYDKKEWKYNSFLKRKELVWKHTSSGIIVHHLDKVWDSSFVLVFPLFNIPNGYKRGDIERAIGNYLIDKGVPIIDFYSHNY